MISDYARLRSRKKKARLNVIHHIRLSMPKVIVLIGGGIRQKASAVTGMGLHHEGWGRPAPVGTPMPEAPVVGCITKEGAVPSWFEHHHW